MQDSLPFPLDKKDLTTRFEEFHAANPHVYRTLVEQARRWVRETGRHKLGAQMLIERVRWVLAITTRGDDYKINNDYAAFYARLLMYREPDLAGLFDLRRSEADGWDPGRAA